MASYGGHREISIPWIGSVYNCRNTSGGSRNIHPAFNGLWQFAGPGHWNDPDMLQAGNLDLISLEFSGYNFSESQI